MAASNSSRVERPEIIIAAQSSAVPRSAAQRRARSAEAKRKAIPRPVTGSLTVQELPTGERWMKRSPMRSPSTVIGPWVVRMTNSAIGFRQFRCEWLHHFKERGRVLRKPGADEIREALHHVGRDREAPHFRAGLGGCRHDFGAVSYT